MLFGYPIAATSNNWLHDSISMMLKQIHADVDAGIPLPGWPAIIPATVTASQKTELLSCLNLYELLEKYGNTLKRLSAPNRLVVRDCIDQQNEIADLLCNAKECNRLADLPKSIRKPISALFEYCFGQLKRLGLRDLQYKVIYEQIDAKLCPFCGCEPLEPIPGPREDLDHYLARTKYPFAAVNLRNLVPMGGKCNRSYKKAVDMLRDSHGAKRVAFNPYATGNIGIDLENSLLFKGRNKNPLWAIDFKPDSAECVTWDAIFQVKDRLSRGVLDQYFRSWLTAFAKWYRRKYPGAGAPASHQISQALEEYCDTLSDMQLKAIEGLRLPVFRMLHMHCKKKDVRLLAFLGNVVTV